MALKGWECKIKFPPKQIQKERMIDVDGNDATGNGAKTTFYTRNFPVTDSAGNVTDDETHVTVYLDGEAQASTSYTLTGTEGRITFATAPTSGKKITITYYYSKLVGYAQSCSISHASNIEAIREIGNRTPAELKEGQQEISLTLERCWLDRDCLGKVSSVENLPEFDVDVMPAGIGAGKPYIRATGKFNGWSMDIGHDAITMESVEFNGKVVTVGTQ